MTIATKSVQKLATGYLLTMIAVVLGLAFAKPCSAEWEPPVKKVIEIHSTAPGPAKIAQFVLYEDNTITPRIIHTIRPKYIQLPVGNSRFYVPELERHLKVLKDRQGVATGMQVGGGAVALLGAFFILTSVMGDAVLPWIPVTGWLGISGGSGLIYAGHQLRSAAKKEHKITRSIISAQEDPYLVLITRSPITEVISTLGTIFTEDALTRLPGYSASSAKNLKVEVPGRPFSATANDYIERR